MVNVDVLLGAAVDQFRRSGALESLALMALVETVNADGTVDVLRGADTFPSVRILSGYPAPAVGDTVQMLRTAGGWVCVGRVETATPDWKPLSLSAGWSIYGDPYYAPAYRINADRTVSMCGLASHAGAAAGSIVGVLPVGARPAAKCRFAGEVRTQTFGTIDISANGNVQIADFTGSGVWCPLDTVRFRLA